MAQEALANVQRHAQASQVRIRLVARRKGFLHLLIEDNGVGISLAAPRAPALAGVGLPGMETREGARRTILDPSLRTRNPHRREPAGQGRREPRQCRHRAAKGAGVDRRLYITKRSGKASIRCRVRGKRCCPVRTAAGAIGSVEWPQAGATRSRVGGNRRKASYARTSG